MNESYIKFFLTYGYFSRELGQSVKFDNFDFDYANYSLDELGKKASDLFVENIEKHYSSGEQHLVPLSGGLDSRAILAALLKFSEAKDIYSFSYGAKGTLDYEIGRHVAQTLGINHISFDLQSYCYTLDDLLYHSTSVQKQTILFHNPPTKQIDSLFNGFTVWSGVVGDVVGGSAVPSKATLCFADAKRDYLKNKIYLNKHIVKNVGDFDKFLYFRDVNDKTKLSFEEKIIFTERYENFYKPLIECGSNRFKEPFVNCDFFDFMCNAPVNYKASSKLYHNMLGHLDRDVFSLPTKNRSGAGLFSSSSEYFYRKLKEKIYRKVGITNISLGTNYQDFRLKYDNQKPFKNLIDSQLEDLKCRKIIDIFDSDSYKLDINLVKTLVSLEVHLKNGKSLPENGVDGC